MKINKISKSESSDFKSSILDNMGRLEYEIELKSGNGKIKFVPYLTKDEKILLLAKEEAEKAKDDKESNRIIINAIIQVMNNSVVSSNMKVEDLPVFDFSYFFSRLISKSNGNTVKMKFRIKHPECYPDGDYPEIEKTIDLEKSEVIFDDTHSKKIILDKTKNFGVTFKYITAKESLEIDSDSFINNHFNLITKSLDTIFMNDDVYDCSDLSQEDKDEFIENLTQAQLKTLTEFFVTMPKFQQVVEIECPKCKKIETKTVRGIKDFFA